MKNKYQGCVRVCVYFVREAHARSLFQHLTESIIFLHCYKDRASEIDALKHKDHRSPECKADKPKQPFRSDKWVDSRNCQQGRLWFTENGFMLLKLSPVFWNALPIRTYSCRHRWFCRRVEAGNQCRNSWPFHSQFCRNSPTPAVCSARSS